jgi:lipopolysaccharide biosynthesis regulator YciM
MTTTYGARPLRRIIQNLIEIRLQRVYSTHGSRRIDGSRGRGGRSPQARAGDGGQGRTRWGLLDPIGKQNLGAWGGLWPPITSNSLIISISLIGEGIVAKVRTSFICQQCGASSHAYMGRCPGAARGIHDRDIEERRQPARAATRRPAELPQP